MLVVNLFGCPGSGKCFGLGTKVLMFDGSIKNIEDIKIGDVVMGDDSMPRTVLDLHRGRSKLYKLHINKLQDLIVSENHILSICYSHRKTHEFIYEDIQIEKFLNRSKRYQEKAKFYQVPVSYAEKTLHIDPYYLGIWLGDGLSESLSRMSISDEEILDYCSKYSQSLGLTLKQHSFKKDSKCQTYCLSSLNNGYTKLHPICKWNKEYNLQNNKHIPIEYLTSSRKQRLELLAGLLDTDGYLKNNCYEITQKNYQLAIDICKLAWSLGYNAIIKDTYKKAQTMETSKLYYRINICGNFEELPVKVKRKKPSNKNKKTYSIHHGFVIKVMPDEGNYYGIEVDGNGRFLLDNCMVVHNSTGAAYIFSKLKLASVNAELVTEFAKDKVWEDTKAVFENQAYIFGKQSFRISRCEGKVDVIVTDSPLPLSIFYNKNTHIYGTSFNKFVMDVFNHYNNYNFFIHRVKPYNPKGRFQSEEESNALKKPMMDFLTRYNIHHWGVSGCLEGYDSIVDTVLCKLREMNSGN